MSFAQKRNNYNCIICGGKIITLDPKIYDTTQVEHMMWDKGVVTTVRMPYGSKFNGNEYIIGVCDECIEHMINDKIIKEIHL